MSIRYLGFCRDSRPHCETCGSEHPGSSILLMEVDGLITREGVPCVARRLNVARSIVRRDAGMAERQISKDARHARETLDMYGLPHQGEPDKEVFFKACVLFSERWPDLAVTPRPLVRDMIYLHQAAILRAAPLGL